MRKKLITIMIVVLSWLCRPTICMEPLQDCLAQCILGCLGLKQTDGTLSTITRESMEEAIQETETNQADEQKKEQENAQ